MSRQRLTHSQIQDASLPTAIAVLSHLGSLGAAGCTDVRSSSSYSYFYGSGLPSDKKGLDYGSWTRHWWDHPEEEDSALTNQRLSLGVYYVFRTRSSLTASPRTTTYVVVVVVVAAAVVGVVIHPLVLLSNCHFDRQSPSSPSPLPHTQ
jgi:hypothetical protein